MNPDFLNALRPFQLPMEDFLTLLAGSLIASGGAMLLMHA